jgi:integrase
VFLDSIERNSRESRNAYHRGLIRFRNFLDGKYLTLTVESILQVSREDEEPIDAKDIRKILLCCNNRRLRTFILILASGGIRAREALAIRLKDVDFSTSHTKIHIRKEFTKTRVARDIYISDEATHYLKQWLDWKYRNKGIEWLEIPNSNDLVFAVNSTNNEPNPSHIYFKIIIEFEKLLTIAGMDERKEGMSRRKITPHSFHRFVKTVISDQTNQDYSEWFLGHNKSPYYTKKEPERREIYAAKCMKHLTFLDYITLETVGKNIEAKLQQKDIEIHTMRQKYAQDIENMKQQMQVIERSQVETQKVLHELRLRNMKLSFNG